MQGRPHLSKKIAAILWWSLATSTQRHTPGSPGPSAGARRGTAGAGTMAADRRAGGGAGRRSGSPTEGPCWAEGTLWGTCQGREEPRRRKDSLGEPTMVCWWEGLATDWPDHQ